MTARPIIVLPPAIAGFAKLPRWVVWKWVKGKDGRLTKPPYQGRFPSSLASSTNPSTWCDLNTAMLAYTEGKCDGIGLVLSESEISAFDLDHCRNATTGEIEPWALRLIERAGSYCEITPSNEGVRIIGLASGDKVHRKFNVANANGMECELYRKADRYITITGNQINKATELANIDALIDETLAELEGTKEKQGKPSGNGSAAEPHKRDLDSLIKDGCGEDFGGDRSRAVWFVINTLLKQGRAVDEIIAVLLERSNGISAHIYDQPKPEAYARKQVEKAQKEQQDDPDVEISRLAKLKPLEYEQQRKGAAERLDIRAAILDKLVAAERARLNPDAGKQGQGQPIEFSEPEPWPDEVKGDALLTEVAKAIRSRIVMSEPERDICTLWAVYTHLVDRFLVAPRLAIRSPTPECGKTTLLSVLEHLVPKPLRTSSVTASVTFRVIAMCQPTLLIDEAKNIADKTDLLEVLNDGHHQGGRTLRNVPIADGYEPRAFATFAALAIALIGSLPPELHGRSVVINLKRRLPGDVIEEIRVGLPSTLTFSPARRRAGPPTTRCASPTRSQ